MHSGSHRTSNSGKFMLGGLLFDSMIPKVGKH